FEFDFDETKKESSKKPEDKKKKAAAPKRKSKAKTKSHAGEQLNLDDFMLNNDDDDYCDSLLDKNESESEDEIEYRIQCTEIQQNCLEELKKERNNLVLQHKVRPINLSLEIMSETLPTTIKDFLEIEEVKEPAFERYGNKFLEILRKYRNIRDKIKGPTVSKHFTKKDNKKPIINKSVNRNVKERGTNKKISEKKNEEEKKENKNGIKAMPFKF
ncbi:hypothetical protein HK096_010831, partial [Nowakowskiella sp. JEL0078]